MIKKKRKVNNVMVLIIIVLFVTILTFPIIFFYWKQFGPELALSHSRWAEFGDYLGGTAGTLFSFLSFIFILITIFLQRKSLNSAMETVRLQQQELNHAKQSLDLTQKALDVQKQAAKEEKTRNIQPVIVFSDNEGGTWKLENAGKGPAINIRIAYQKMGKGNKFRWDDVVIAPAFSVGDEEILTWIEHPKTLVAVYQDMEERYYTTVSSDNRNRIEPGDEEYKLSQKEKPIGIWKKRLDWKKQKEDW